VGIFFSFLTKKQQKIRTCQSDSYTRLLQMIHPLFSLEGGTVNKQKISLFILRHVEKNV